MAIIHSRSNTSALLGGRLRLLFFVVLSVCLSLLVQSAAAVEAAQEGVDVSGREPQEDNDNPSSSSSTTTETPNLRFGFGGIRDNSDNRELVRLHSELKLIFEEGVSTSTSDVVKEVLNDPAAVTALQEVTGLYFYQLFQNTEDQAFVGKNAKFSMDDVQLLPESEYPIHFVAQIEMDKSVGGNDVSSKDIQRLLTNRHWLNEYLKELKETSSSNAYRHVEKVVLLVIRHGNSHGDK